MVPEFFYNHTILCWKMQKNGRFFVESYLILNNVNEGTLPPFRCKRSQRTRYLIE